MSAYQLIKINQNLENKIYLLMVYVFFGQSLLKSQAIESYYMYKQKSKQQQKQQQN